MCVTGAPLWNTPGIDDLGLWTAGAEKPGHLGERAVDGRETAVDDGGKRIFVEV
jgi:hypothetical protein